MFDNDVASKWIAMLDASKGTAQVDAAIAAVGEGVADDTTTWTALAAAHVVAAMRGRAADGLPAAARTFTGGVAGADEELVARARAAVQHLFEGSIVAQQGGDDEGWEDIIGDLLDRLEPAGGTPMLGAEVQMKRVVVRYKVKSDKADENKQLIEAVFAELKETSPAGIRYASFIAEDGLTFVHVASIETDDGSNPLGATDAFKAFQAEIKDRCDEPPQATWLTEVGSYGFFD